MKKTYRTQLVEKTNMGYATLADELCMDQWNEKLAQVAGLGFEAPAYVPSGNTQAYSAPIQAAHMNDINEAVAQITKGMDGLFETKASESAESLVEEEVEKIPYARFEDDFLAVYDFVYMKKQKNAYTGGALYPGAATNALPKYPLNRFEREFAEDFVGRVERVGKPKDMMISVKQAAMLKKIADKARAYVSALDQAFKAGEGIRENAEVKKKH